MSQHEANAAPGASLRYKHLHLDAEEREGQYMVYATFESGTGPEPDLASEGGCYRTLVFRTPAVSEDEAISKYRRSLKSFVAGMRAMASNTTFADFHS